jgi:hypothetical protein
MTNDIWVVVKRLDNSLFEDKSARRLPCQADGDIMGFLCSKVPHVLEDRPKLTAEPGPETGGHFDGLQLVAISGNCL